MMTTTVLFDLDDTLFDHKYCRLCGLHTLQKQHQALLDVPIAELEREHEKLLAANYMKVLDRAATMEDARVERTMQLFRRYGVTLMRNEAMMYSNLYGEAYDSNRRAVPGVMELLEKLKKNVKTGIVSNGLLSAQCEKVRVCKLEDLIDFMVISEEAGCRKPDKDIFKTTLTKAGSKAEETIYIGDSWENDILGASQCGMKTIWLNRYGGKCPGKEVCMEIDSYDNKDAILQFIFA